MSKSRLISFSILAALATWLSACGGESGGASPGLASTSGLAASAKLISLTAAEKGQLCDWAVAKLGGYGLSCNSDWAFMSYPDQATCIEDGPSATSTPNCQATVGQMEACVNAIPKCASFADLQSSSVCAPLTTC